MAPVSFIATYPFLPLLVAADEQTRSGPTPRITVRGLGAVPHLERVERQKRRALRHLTYIAIRNMIVGTPAVRSWVTNDEAVK
jgi:hypothetical protein